MQRIHDIGLPNWPALLVDEKQVVVVGRVRTVGGYRAAWYLATLACLICCAATIWFSFGYAFRTADWYGNYTVPPTKSDVWMAVIISVVALIGFPTIFRRWVINPLANAFATRYLIHFDHGFVKIRGGEVIPRRDEHGKPVAVQFWVIPHEQYRRQADATTNQFMKSIYKEAYLIVATVQSRIGQRRIALGVVLTEEDAGNFASVCNAANSVASGMNGRRGNSGDVDGGDIRDMPM